MVIFDSHSNIIAAALELETLLPPPPVRTQGNMSSAYNAATEHWNHADAYMIFPSFKEPLDITDGLDVEVGEGSIKYLAHFRLFH